MWYAVLVLTTSFYSTARLLPIANSFQEFFVHVVLSPDS